jgi:hypothetical protein
VEAVTEPKPVVFTVDNFPVPVTDAIAVQVGDRTMELHADTVTGYTYEIVGERQVNYLMWGTFA